MLRYIDNLDNTSNYNEILSYGSVFNLEEQSITMTTDGYAVMNINTDGQQFRTMYPRITSVHGNFTLKLFNSTTSQELINNQENFIDIDTTELLYIQISNNTNPTTYFTYTFPLIFENLKCVLSLINTNGVQTIFSKLIFKNAHSMINTITFSNNDVPFVNLQVFVSNDELTWIRIDNVSSIDVPQWNTLYYKIVSTDATTLKCELTQAQKQPFTIILE